VLKITQRSQITHESKLYINTTDHSFFTAKKKQTKKTQNSKHAVSEKKYIVTK